MHHGKRKGSESSEDEKNRKRGPRYIEPGLNGPLLSYKHFMEIQRNALDMKEAEVLYAKYKKAHSDKQNEIFFAMHKEDHWFKEKYHPEQSYQWQTERRVQAQLLAKKFFDHLKKEVYQVGRSDLILCIEH